MEKTAPPKAAASWADKVKVTDASMRYTLNRIPKQTHGSRLQVPKHLFEDNANPWVRCLVGFFPGARLPFHAVKSIATRVWKTQGLEQVLSTANGFILFRFREESQLLEILERGPWIFGGKSILLQQWHPRIYFDKSKISSIPVWIRLRGLPFPLWTKEGLSLAASMVGKPLSCDEHTFKCSRLDYARICVEVEAAHPYVHSFELESPTMEDPIQVSVEYEWKPARCPTCKLYGHNYEAAQPQAPSASMVAQTEEAVTATGTTNPTNPKLHTITPKPKPTQQTAPQPNHQNPQPPPPQLTINPSQPVPHEPPIGKDKTTKPPKPSNKPSSTTHTQDTTHTQAITHILQRPPHTPTEDTVRTNTKPKSKETHPIDTPDGTSQREICLENKSATLHSDSLDTCTSSSKEVVAQSTACSQAAETEVVAQHDSSPPPSPKAVRKKKGGKKGKEKCSY